MSSTLIDRTKMTGVSPSPVKALDSESSMRRFESYYPCQSFSSSSKVTLTLELFFLSPSGILYSSFSSSFLENSLMQRFTVSLDDDLAIEFDKLIKLRNYTNRSKAIRDLLHEMLSTNEFDENPQAESVAVVSYVYNHHERQLAMRLTEHQHHHSGMVVSTMHVHITPEDCAETVVIRGPYQEVKDLAQGLIVEPGIRHGNINIMLVTEHSAEETHEHGHDHAHTHDHEHEHHQLTTRLNAKYKV